MRTKIANIVVLIAIIALYSCDKEEKKADVNIIFLHHSTGEFIWHGKPPSVLKKAAKKINSRFADRLSDNAVLPKLFQEYNKESGKNYQISEFEFPKVSPYGWNNYPYDYYNIWVKNAGDKPFKKEPTLEILTNDYQVVIFKHCYPVSSIREDLDSADVNSHVHTISNYKLQYTALKEKLLLFPETKFILFTGAVQVKANLSENEAKRAKEFFDWVKNDWDTPGDNIYLWDLYGLQTEGGLYFKDEFSVSPLDSHPNKEFASKVVQLLFNRIIDVIEEDGGKTTNTGHRYD